MDHEVADMVCIIIPTLNEEKALPATLDAVFGQTGDYEVVVVDGGSHDRTQEIVASYPRARLITANRGRAAQMNAGARVATTEWLLFLHADTLLPPGALKAIDSFTHNQAIQAGCFHQQFSGQHGLLRAISRLHNWRFKRSRIIYGDQAMFVRRSLFGRLNGFPTEPILEDVLFSEKLVQVTKPLIMDAAVITDSRKFVQRGICRSFAEVAIILICYELRLPIMARGFFSAVR
jgi:rSAM/selenodomain-associated transferase 2